MCYECGQRRRNLPFKLCTQCYRSQRQRGSRGKQRGIPVASPIQSGPGVEGEDCEAESALSEVVESFTRVKVSDNSRGRYYVAGFYPEEVRQVQKGH